MLIVKLRQGGTPFWNLRQFGTLFRGGGPIISISHNDLDRFFIVFLKMCPRVFSFNLFIYCLSKKIHGGYFNFKCLSITF